MKLIIDKNRKVYSAGTWGTKNENNYEILDFEFPEELDGYNKRIVYYLGDERVWDAIVNNKAYITNAITKYEKVNAYVWLTKNETITLKYVCDGTEEGNYYFTYDNVNYYFTMPEVEENDELIFDVATSTLKLDNTTIATTTTGTGTELTFETIIDAEEDFRTQLFEMQFYENENSDGIVPTEQQVDGFNTMLTAMNNKIAEVNALEQTIGAAERTRQANETTRQNNETTRQENEQTRQSQEAERERKTDEAIGNIEDKTAEYNQNAEEKTEAFNTNASQKTNDFNSNYTQKVNDFNTNASSKESAFNSNASSKTSAFDSNAETKTNAFNTNATNKTNDFNSNATEKTSEFNTNAESKTSAFNDNATQKTTNFDNNANSKTTTFNENAQAKTDAFDEHTAEMQQEIDELSANMPWNETEQGTYLDITDAAKYSRNHLKVFGNTEQASYSGKNLLNYNLTPEKRYIDANGEYVDEPASSSNYFVNQRIDNIVPGQTYVFSNNGITGTYVYVRVAEYTQNGTFIKRSLLSNNNSNIVLDALTSYIILSTNKDSNKYFDNPQIEQGSTATDYEPYVGGVPSPNPDYPQPIHVVTGNNSIGVTGKNLLDLADKTDGSITSRKLPVKLKPGTYVFSCDDANVSIAIRLSETNQTGSQSVVSTTNYTSGTRRYVTITTTFDAEYINISTSNTPATNMQLEEGSTPSDYELYTHTDYPLDLCVSKNRLNINTSILSTYITNAGATGASQSSDLSDYIYVKKGQAYTISYDYETLLANQRSLCFYDVSKTYISGQYYDCRIKSHTITPAQNGYIRFAYDKNCYDIQVEEGDTATEYVPYNSLELCGAQPTATISRRDEIFKNNPNSKYYDSSLIENAWYKLSRIYKHQFTPGHNNPQQTGNHYYYRLTPTPMHSMGYMKGYIYDGRASGFNNMPDYHFGFENSGVLHIQNTNATDATSMRDILVNAEEVLYYALATPTKTQITDTTLISQLDAIYNHLALVKGTNHITITPSDLEPNMQLTYMQDLKSKLDNLDSRLALLE